MSSDRGASGRRGPRGGASTPPGSGARGAGGTGADETTADTDPPPARVVVPDGTPVGMIVELTPPAKVARAALERARVAAAAKGLRPGQQPVRRGMPVAGGTPGPGARDPQAVGDTIEKLLRERGWTQDVSVGGVIGRWRDVVGEQVADHCTPEAFDAGVLTVRTDSTAWATNLKLLVPQLLGRLATEVGEGVVVEVQVLGPAGPGFRRGPRTVRGRGPRDTWG